MNQSSVLILPGWQNSGPQHWQSIWQEQNPAFRRVEQRDWLTPGREEWVNNISAELQRTPAAVVVAHSLGCIAVAHWAQTPIAKSGMVKGALLVAPADVDRTDAPYQIKDFAPVPLRQLPFPSMVVASSDDWYISLQRAQAFAEAWGSQFFNIGKAGHINADSGLGDWPEGKRLMRLLLEPVAIPPSH
ncbi:MAG TPA: alpha/beta hydrolase [Candidatus Saccharimonadales bacterium]|jgi:predicted alpha/beta hydrolase family esterase|nr:alpha/beta hydrolase [Candidatus Saccharimonadales bacterium]